MTRALVLGGGGPLGVGWQAGLLTGLADAGVDLGDADYVVGTSAGAIVGAQLTSGRRPADLVAPISTTPAWLPDDPDGEPVDIEEIAASGRVPTVSEADWVDHFSFLGGSAWPPAFHATAFALGTGQPVIWDHTSGVPLPRAVASSCTVPFLVPAVKIGDDEYIDGGARDSLNADLAAGHERVVAVSCMALDAPEGAMPELLAGLIPGVRQRIEDLRATGSAVEVVEPSDAFAELSGWGRYLIDVRRTAAAFETGLAQGAAEAGRLGSFW
jgi:NTE family protein